MFTSCCPAWVNLVECDYPELIPHLSSCKSPQQMMGAAVKEVWCTQMGFKVCGHLCVCVCVCVAVWLCGCVCVCVAVCVRAFASACV
jgi:iron only hydrogenase large subunit-like protein